MADLPGILRQSHSVQQGRGHSFSLVDQGYPKVQEGSIHTKTKEVSSLENTCTLPRAHSDWGRYSHRS